VPLPLPCGGLEVPWLSGDSFIGKL